MAAHNKKNREKNEQCEQSIIVIIIVVAEMDMGLVYPFTGRVGSGPIVWVCVGHPDDTECYAQCNYCKVYIQ